jgi:hypothetical protein
MWRYMIPSSYPPDIDRKLYETYGKNSQKGRAAMEGSTKSRVSVNTCMYQSDLQTLDELAQRTGRNRSQTLRLLIREAKVREPDIVVELTPAMATAKAVASC